MAGGKYYGVNATLNVWTPAAYGTGLFSVAQLWLLSGTQDELNTIEAGWIVSFSNFRRWCNNPDFSNVKNK